MGFGWGDAINLYGIYSADQAAGDARDNAQQISSDAISAAMPKSVYDPLGYATYDEENERYNLGMSPISQGMFNRAMQDVQRYREQLTPYMKDPEGAAQQRYNENLTAIQPGMNDATNKMMSNLNTRGMMGSSVGAGIASKKDREDSIRKSQLMSSSRSGVQSDITNMLNREAAARKRALGFAGAGQSLANIGTGIGNTAGTIASSAAPGLINATNSANQVRLEGINSLLGMVAPANNTQAPSSGGYTMVDGVGVWNPQ